MANELTQGKNEQDRDSWTAHLGLLNRRRILIVGCGHCGAALARQMHLLDFQIYVVDPRDEQVTFRSLPPGIKTVGKPYSKAAHGIEHARLTCVVVMTPSYPDDVDALTSLLPHPFPFVGVMGSPSKLKKIRDELFAFPRCRRG